MLSLYRCSVCHVLYVEYPNDALANTAPPCSVTHAHQYGRYEPINIKALSYETSEFGGELMGIQTDILISEPEATGT